MKKILLTLLALTVTAGSVLAQKRQTQVAIDDGSGKYGLIKTGLLTGNHTYTLPDADGTLLLTVVGGYLPLSGGTMTGALNMGAFSITGALIGNASTATKLFTARNINGVAFDGSADITVPAAAGTLTGAALASGVTSSSLTSVGTLTALTMGGTLAMGANNITGTGQISATTFNGALNGNANTASALSPGNTINGVTFTGAAPITVAAAAGTLTGTVLASNVVTSSLTTVGTLGNLTVTNPITGSVTGSAASFTGTLGGDVTGNQGTTTVGKIKGMTVPDTASLATGYLKLTPNAGGSPTLSWSSNGVTLAGDVTGASSATTVAKIKGMTVPDTASSATGYLKLTPVAGSSPTLSWASSSGSGTVTPMRNSSNDTTIQKSPVFKSVSGMSFSIAASEVWGFEFSLSTNVSGGGQGIKYQISIPSGATVEAIVVGNANNTTSQVSDRISAGSTATSAFNTGAVDGFVTIRGVVQNSTNPGTVQLLFGKGGTDANMVTIYKNSFGVAYKF